MLLPVVVRILALSFPKEFIFKEHMILFFVQFIDFAEPVHVELTDEGLDLLVSEIER